MAAPSPEIASVITNTKMALSEHLPLGENFTEKRDYLFILCQLFNQVTNQPTK